MAKTNTYKSVEDFARNVLELDEHEIWLIKAKNDMIRRIIRSRKQQGLSQQELAEMLGTTQSVMSRMETGLSKGFTLDYLTRVVDRLGMVTRLTVRKAG